MHASFNAYLASTLSSASITTSNPFNNTFGSIFGNRNWNSFDFNCRIYSFQTFYCYFNLDFTNIILRVKMLSMQV